MSKLFFEDLSVGQIFGSGHYELTAQSIIDFASQWDPQHFHTDEAAAQDSFFNGLAASGWQTGAITMRLLTQSSFQPINGIIGSGLESLKWHRPVRPGDVLTLRIEILEMRLMKSRPGWGLVRIQVDTLDAAGELVQTFTSQVVVQGRDALAAT